MIEEKKIPTSLFVLFFSILSLLVLSFTMTSMASAYIASDLGADRTITFYLLSFFGFGTSITLPLARPLVKKWGASKTLLCSLFLFALCNQLSSYLPTYFWLVVFRFLAGCCVGPCYPLINFFLTTLAKDSIKNLISWIFATVLVTTPVIGAAFGGVVAYLYDWRFLFFFNSSLALLFNYLLFKKRDFLQDLNIDYFKPHQRFDWIGWIFYAVGISCLTFAATTAQQLDWYRSDLWLFSFVMGSIALFYFFLRSMDCHSVLALDLFSHKEFSLGSLALVTLFSIYFGVIVLLSIWLTFDVKFTPVWISTLIGIMGIAALFPRFVLDKNLLPIDPKTFILLATLFLAISCFYTSRFNVEINFGRIAFSRVLAGIGLALFLPSILDLLFKTFPKERRSDIFLLFQVMRNLASGLGASIYSITWQRRTVFYYERLNEGLNPTSQNLKLFFQKVKSFHLQGAPQARLNHFLSDQASALGLEDVFFLMGWILVFLGLIFIFYRFFENRYEALD